MDSDDNTAIINMKKSFDKFMSGDNSRKRSILEISGSSHLETSQLSLDQSNFRDPSIMKVKTDLLYCKGRIGMLESQLNSREAEAKEMVILHEREISELKHKHDRELRGYSVLKTSHERVLHRQELCESELEDTKEQLERIKAAYDEKMHQLQKRNMEQEMSYIELLEEQKSNSRELRSKNIRLQSELSVAASELSLVNEQFSNLKRKLSDAETNAASGSEWRTRAKQSEERVKQLEAEMDRYKDDMQMMSARKTDLARLTDVTQENKKLNNQVAFYKMTVENNEVVKERAQTLERQLKNHEQLQERVATLEVENENYRYLVDELKEQKVPEDTVVRLREAMDKEAVMLENIGELKSKNRLLENRVEELEGLRVTLKSKMSGASQDSAKLNNEMERLQRQLFLITKERDGYKKIVESYECEVTREVVSLDTDKAAQLERMVKQYSSANEQLEKGLRSKQEENARMKDTIEELKSTSVGQSTQPCGEKSAAIEVEHCQLLELRQKIEALEKECEQVREENDILEARIEQRDMQGDYDPTKTKVLHMIRNPVSQAQQARGVIIKSLNEENARLRERIKVLEGKLEEAHDVTAQVEANLKAPSAQESQQFTELKDKLASSEKRYGRIVEMFRTTSLEFRQVVYMLTGFRIDIPKSKEYKLMNMYANSPEDFLLFQETAEGELQLLETPYALSISELAEDYLQNQHSIPLFLSSLTVDLYKQSTMQISMM